MLARTDFVKLFDDRGLDLVDPSIGRSCFCQGARQVALARDIKLGDRREPCFEVFPRRTQPTDGPFQLLVFFGLRIAGKESSVAQKGRLVLGVSKDFLNLFGVQIIIGPCSRDEHSQGRGDLPTQRRVGRDCMIIVCSAAGPWIRDLRDVRHSKDFVKPRRSVFDLAVLVDQAANSVEPESPHGSPLMAVGKKSSCFAVVVDMAHGHAAAREVPGCVRVLDHREVGLKQEAPDFRRGMILLAVVGLGFVVIRKHNALQPMFVCLSGQNDLRWRIGLRWGAVAQPSNDLHVKSPLKILLSVELSRAARVGSTPPQYEDAA